MSMRVLDQNQSDIFSDRVAQEEGQFLQSLCIDTIQANLGLRCNMLCRHCHLAAGPKRREQMSWETMGAILKAARQCGCRMIDLTGGAPEMNPHFRRFVQLLHDERFHIQVRTNLTILLEPGYEDVASFMADRMVSLVASLPCYLEENVDMQRGPGAYHRSVEALRVLNRRGYGIREDLPLDLIFNPIGPALPPSQEELEATYRRELKDRFGIHFSHLHTITNMPIGRFWAKLRAQKRDEAYLALLRENYNTQTLPGLMCRHQISVDWNGTIHDCDFNLALELAVNHAAPSHILEFDLEALRRRRIVTGLHCFGCTAGCGSSCAGALVKTTRIQRNTEG